MIVGFIDYIVSPTLTVIGDSLDLILGTLDIPPNFDFLRGFFQIFLSKKSPKPTTFPCKNGPLHSNLRNVKMVPYILNWLYSRYGPEYNLWFSLTIVGFLRGPKPPTLPCKEKKNYTTHHNT